MKICFVALEILGPFTGGGIATALAGQAEHHAAEHEVTVLYVHPGLSAEDAPKWEAYYASRDIRFIRAEFDTFYPLDNIPKRSYAVKEYLEAWDEEFDVIFFHDYLGLGYYAALARRLGLAFPDTLMGTVIHGPSEWARTLNMVNDHADDITLYELERKQAEYSDFVVAPSQHILDWCAEQGWALPDNTRPISNILPHRVDLHTGLAPGDRVEGLDELAYFGRLEIRKGFFTFLDAVKYLHKNNLRLPRRITFLGAFCTNGERNSASTVLEYAQDWDCEIQFLNNYDHAAAIGYLVNNRPLTVVASRDESFGLTAYECLKFGVPTLIADRGALTTLPAAPERDEILFEPRANVLARRIAAALDEGIVIAGVDPVHDRAPAAWDALLADLAAADRAADPRGAAVSLQSLTDTSMAQSGRASEPDQPPAIPGDETPLVSVVMVHHNRPHLLRTALASVLAQTYEAIEILIVDDGSTAGHYRAVEKMVEEADDPRIRLLRQENAYLGAARNFGVSHASGSYLLFMDDDNVAAPEEIEVFVTVAQRTGAEVLNSVSRMFRSAGEDRIAFDTYLPVGPSLPLAIFGNTFGDANALVSRALFDRLGGFTERYAVGCEDYEFFTRAFLSGAKMQLVPQMLFEYRSDEDGMMKELNSGKYIINQLRGVNALFDTHRMVDLAQLRGVMRVGFYTGVDREYKYWIGRSVERRKFSELEDQLGNMKYRPNSPKACEVVVKLLAAYGRIREAVSFMERNAIEPDDQMLRQMQKLLSRHERREMNAGRQPNIALNGAFEFWTMGTNFSGVDPYQYFANEWLAPSSKVRQHLSLRQEIDNSLFAQTHCRRGTYLRAELTRPDPEGYLFIAQRNPDIGRVLGNEIVVSFLGRASFTGPLTVFLRITYQHGTDEFQDIWPDKQAWVSEHWERSEMRFDLTDHMLEDARDGTFFSLFITVPTGEAMTLDITDVTIAPFGEGMTLEPYIRENERQRAEARCFVTGKDAHAEPLGGTDMAITLAPGDAGRLNGASRLHLRAPLVLTLTDGNFLEVAAGDMSVEHLAGGPPRIRMTGDRPLPAEGAALQDFLVVTNYLEG